MKLFIILFVPIILFAQGPFDTPAPHSFKLSVFNTQKTIENKQAVENEKIKCRRVCDKKIYKEQVMGDAITFYTNSKDYSFNK